MGPYQYRPKSNSTTLKPVFGQLVLRNLEMNYLFAEISDS